MKNAKLKRDCDTTEDSPLVKEFTAKIVDIDYPCLGARSAFRQGQVQFFMAGDMNDASDDPSLLEAIYSFNAAVRSRPESLGRLATFVVIFQSPTRLTDEAFEALLWKKLQNLHDLDSRQFPWDNRVNSDPNAPDFSFSLGGHAYFVIGGHPNSSRRSRRFPRPSLVFNLHEQFEQLRSTGAFEKFKQAVRARDKAYSGSENPMLDDHGQSSEAKQYSGRVVAEEWRCPFHASQSHSSSARMGQHFQNPPREEAPE